MADPKNLDKTIYDEPDAEDNGIPAGFPENVNPSPENIKAYNAQVEKDRKAIEDGKPLDDKPRVGEGTVTDGTVEGQRKTVSK